MGKEKVNQFLTILVWIFEREDDTLRLRFRNSITGEIKYDKPYGLLLEDFEEEVWEENLR